MSEPLSVAEVLTKQFYDWELRGRGWQVWESPVEPEPPFRPFTGHHLPRDFFHDDGQLESPLSRWTTGLFGKALPRYRPAVSHHRQRRNPRRTSLRRCPN